MPYSSNTHLAFFLAKSKQPKLRDKPVPLQKSISDSIPPAEEYERPTVDSLKSCCQRLDSFSLASEELSQPTECELPSVDSLMSNKLSSSEADATTETVDISSDLSVISINSSNSTYEMSERGACSAVPQEMREESNYKRRDSIDELLADISACLTTPVREQVVAFSPLLSNSIITGHDTPEVHHKHLNSDKYDKSNANSTTETECEVSLFTLDETDDNKVYATTSENGTGLLLTRSTPLADGCQKKEHGGDMTPRHSATFGEFDLVPQLSLLSFND